MYWTANSTEDLEQIAQKILTALGPRRVVALIGEMGAGKTTFVNAFCRALGIKGGSSSPTFSLINTYGYTDRQGQKHLLYHLDLYRLNHIQEALDIGIEDLLEGREFCLIEWPQLIEPLLPPDTAVLQLTHREGDARDFRLSFW